MTSQLNSIIVLHSFWRASSTYFWKKFRHIDELVAFYEPFNESLSDINFIPKGGTGQWESRHPVTKSYWDEYSFLDLPAKEIFLQNKGEYLGTDYYNFSDKKRKYIKLIIDRAIEKGANNIVLSCTRSIAFSLDIKNYLMNLYPETKHTHVYLKRDPFEQFQSALIQKYIYSNEYFLAAHVCPLISNNTNISKACGFNIEGINSFKGVSLFEAIISYSKRLPIPAIAYAKAYITNTSISLIKANRAFDLEIVLEDLDKSNKYKSYIQTFFENMHGISISLDDFSLKKHNAILSRRIFNAIEEDLESLGIIPPTKLYEENLNLEISSTEYTNKINDFPSINNNDVLLSKIADLESKLEEELKKRIYIYRELI